MSDAHLNLFYTYNRDPELIENNLTRAFIVSLDLLSGSLRNGLLRLLFGMASDQLPAGIDPAAHNFSKAEVALQRYMDRDDARKARHQYILALASRRYGPNDHSHTPEMVDESSPEVVDLGISAIPDGWIYDPNHEYCFLVEAKVGSNRLDWQQVYDHASNWFAIYDFDQVRRQMLSLSWYDVLETISQTFADVKSELLAANEQECAILRNLVGYIEFFGYRLLAGFDFESLQAPPAAVLYHRVLWMDFSGLAAPPLWRLLGRVGLGD